jgi:hypothetical protein
MSKSNKNSTRKPVNRASVRPPAPLVNSLPAQILEEAAQGWLKSSGAATSPSSPIKSRAPKSDELVDCLDATLKDLRREMAELRERVARLEGRNA